MTTCLKQENQKIVDIFSCIPSIADMITLSDIPLSDISIELHLRSLQIVHHSHRQGPHHTGFEMIQDTTNMMLVIFKTLCKFSRYPDNPKSHKRRSRYSQESCGYFPSCPFIANWAYMTSLLLTQVKRNFNHYTVKIIRFLIRKSHIPI